MAPLLGDLSVLHVMWTVAAMVPIAIRLIPSAVNFERIAKVGSAGRREGRTPTRKMRGALLEFGLQPVLLSAVLLPDAVKGARQRVKCVGLSWSSGFSPPVVGCVAAGRPEGRTPTRKMRGALLEFGPQPAF